MCILTKLYTHTAPHRPLGKGRFPRPLSSRAQLQETCTMEIFRTCSTELDRCTDNCATGIGTSTCVICLTGLSAKCVSCVLEEVVVEQNYGMCLIIHSSSHVDCNHFSLSLSLSFSLFILLGSRY